MAEILDIAEKLQTPEGKIHFLEILIKEKGDKALPYARKIVKEAASDIAKRYENGNPDDEAAKIFEDIGLLGEAYYHYLKAGNLYKSAKIAKKLGMVEEAKKHALQYIEKAEIEKKIDRAEDYLKLAAEAKEFGLQDKAVELIAKGVEEAVKVNPEYALQLMEEEERKNGVKINEEVRRKVNAEVAKKCESEGKFQLAAIFSKKAGLKELAEIYERIWRREIKL